MNNKMKILVTFANQYDVDNSRGTTLNYFFWGENGEAFKTTGNPTGAVGYQRAKNTLPYEMREKITWAPAIYNAEFEMSVGSDGKPVMKVKDLEYFCDVEIKAKPLAASK